ncbi:MAG: MBOAT family protein [Bacteroidetes bacterium]|jgi:D-alanyl-lipoteichoic acid acyltransferase DltB (MBOAT superfamily)|nr:MBOAT family protein [Bacteroidota bacterium]
MLFNSIDYFLFLPLVAVVYFLTPVRWRWAWLLVASYYFYMFWNPWYIGLIVGSTLIDYVAAIQIGGTKDKRRKKAFLGLSIAANLGLLFTFKYFNFFGSQIEALLQNLGMGMSYSLYLDILLPVGISFYTFQTMAYTIDVYRGYTKPERHLGKYALYVTFFPQLVAGPIERSRNLLKQFHFDYSFDYQRVVQGLRLILWGIFKKIVIADRLGMFVNKVYAEPAAYEGFTVWMASIFFLFQIYCDFSGYTDIAIGSARILGINLSKNFENRIYVVTSFNKFWRGWHITLTSWFRDYVYFPLAGQRRSLHWLVWAGVFTFMLNGLWHGAEWTFIIWGGLNGLFIAGETYLQKPKVQLYNRLQTPSWLRQAIGFAVAFGLANLSIIFFRAFNVQDAWTLVVNSFHFAPIQLHESYVLVSGFEFQVSIALIVFMDWLHRLMKGQRVDQWLEQLPTAYRWGFYLLIFHLILYLGVPEQNQFIYFDF